jgi:DNA-binding Lrp family transcriptional regulator
MAMRADGDAGRFWGRGLKLDDTDRALMALLHRDGRMRNKRLAEAAGLSASACHARVRRLETGGAIEGYRAALNWRLLGAEFDAWAELNVDAGGAQSFAAFLADAPAIRSAHRLAQPNAFLVHILARSVDAWREFLSAAERAGFALQVTRFNLALDCVKAPGASGALL